MLDKSSDEPGGSSRKGATPATSPPEVPEIDIAAIRYGAFETASRLNPRFVAGRSLLLATLEIRWVPADPRHAIAGLEARLLEFSPGFRHHECRGMEAYHVFSRSVGARRGGRRPARAAKASMAAVESYDASLALAHLLEHALIDFLCEVTGESTCSGVTGAHRGDAPRFDLMVECGDFALGCCCLALALSWSLAALQGHGPGIGEKDVLEALRWVWLRGARAVFSTRLAAARDWREERAARALAALQDTGFLEVLPYNVSFSGLPEYRRAGAPIPTRAAAGEA